MLQPLSISLRTGLLFTMVVFVACTDAPGSSGSSGQCKKYEVPAGTDLRSPVVSFRKDVQPILQQACAFSSCHGSPSANANQGIFLGSDPAAVRTGMVGVKSRALADMDYVRPGEPEQSFLIRKIDGDHCTLDDRCVNGKCGDPMPQGNPLLPVSSRDVLRRWVAQGAEDN